MGKKLIGKFGALAAGVGALALLAASAPAGAQTILFGGASGGYSGSLDFSFGNGSLTVTINNTNNASPQSDGNAIIAIGFNLSGSPGTLSIDSNYAGLYELTIPKHGSPTTRGALTNANLTDPWSLAGSPYNGDSILLGVLSGGQPTDLVVNNGDPMNHGGFSHSPYLVGGVKSTGAPFQDPTFQLDASGITSSTTASDAEIYFGTNRSSNGLPNGPVVIPPNPTPAGPLPVPATLPLTAAGGLGLLVLALRKRKATI